MTASERAYAAARWPWRMTTTFTNGDVREDDYAADFDPVGFAKHVSAKPDVDHVELSTRFVGGEQVTPAHTEASTR